MLEYWPTSLGFSEESKLAVGQVTETVLTRSCSFLVIDVGLRVSRKNIPSLLQNHQFVFGCLSDLLSMSANEDY